ncbi:hypothetical protein [Photobacterium sp. J15]|uniref:hypothetical protein n=1 Tax=Photobacterium sp. J15 TaxID=265901 RepID=UPI0007E360E8|nr:hypothetical protein [Photobacterium sp. J15]
MVKQYAVFSSKHPVLHWMFMLTFLLTMVVSSYLLLETEQLAYIGGMALPVLPFILFARASNYKKKYL